MNTDELITDIPESWKVTDCRTCKRPLLAESMRPLFRSVNPPGDWTFPALKRGHFSYCCDCSGGKLSVHPRPATGLA